MCHKKGQISSCCWQNVHIFLREILTELFLFVYVKNSSDAMKMTIVPRELSDTCQCLKTSEKNNCESKNNIKKKQTKKNLKK